MPIREWLRENGGVISLFVSLAGFVTSAISLLGGLLSPDVAWKIIYIVLAVVVGVATGVWFVSLVLRMREWLEANWQWLLLFAATVVGALGTWWDHIAPAPSVRLWPWFASLAPWLLAAAVVAALIHIVTRMVKRYTAAIKRVEEAESASERAYAALHAIVQELEPAGEIRWNAQFDVTLHGTQGTWAYFGVRGHEPAVQGKARGAAAWLVEEPAPIESFEAEVLVLRPRDGTGTSAGIDVLTPEGDPDKVGQNQLARLQLHARGRACLTIPDGKGFVRDDAEELGVEAGIFHALRLERTDDGYKAIVDGKVIGERTDPWPEEVRLRVRAWSDTGRSVTAFFRQCQFELSAEHEDPDREVSD